MIIKGVEAVRRLFRERKVPATQQRLAIYGVLASSREHPSAERIHAALRRDYPSLSLATVYKTLQTFEKLGLATVVNVPHTEARYDAITEVHHHAICEGCGRIQDLFDARLDRLPLPRGARGFRPAAHSVHFYGRCADCAGRDVASPRSRGASDKGAYHGQVIEGQRDRG